MKKKRVGWGQLRWEYWGVVSSEHWRLRGLCKPRVWCGVMQGLALYSGTNSFMHKLNTDSVSSFELTAINTNSLSTGMYWLDAALSRISLCEATLYFPATLPLTSLGVMGLCYTSALLFSSTVSDALLLTALRSQLWTDVELLSLSYKHAYSQVGVSYDAVHNAVLGFGHIVESFDIFLLGLELFCAVMLFAQLATLKGRLQRQVSGYDDIVTFCQVRGVSVTEVFGLLTFALGFIFFDMFVTLAEDDSLEALSYVFASVIACAVILLFLAADVQFYFLISSISGGELTLRVLYTDIVNNGLCLLRIFFCWVRYLFYDLQAELVDLAFHYTEVGDEVVLESFASFEKTENSYLWALLANLSGMLLVIFLDLVSIVFQVLIGAFKLFLALFLFWLILDLFLLRTVAHSESMVYLSTLRRK